MPQVDEFGLISRLFAPLAARHPGALGLTDDAALLDCPPGHRLVLTADALVAGVHFFPDDPADLIARKAVRVNVSDLAAMGARPAAVMLAACFPKGTPFSWMECFASGLKADLEEFAIPLIGGDTVATPGPATFSITALGYVENGQELRRSTARSGDSLWVSGTIGDAALGLLVAQGQGGDLSETDLAALLDRYRLPRPRLALGPALTGLASACMDVSDGLVGDLGHICKASGVGAILNADAVPLSKAAQAMIAARPDLLETALTGGDDYELLFTAPPSAAAELEVLSRTLGLRLSRIGTIIEGQGVLVRRSNGEPLPLHSGSYRHF